MDNRWVQCVCLCVSVSVSVSQAFIPEIFFHFFVFFSFAHFPVLLNFVCVCVSVNLDQFAINTDLLVSLIFILFLFFGCVRLCARFAVSLTELISFLSLISRYISYTDLKMEAQKRVGSQRARFLATRFSQYGKLTVL